MAGTAVIIVAAGRGQRFGAPTPKQYLHVAGAPVIRHAVAAFADHPGISVIQPVIHPDDREVLADALSGLTYAAPVAGGAARQDSVRNGLAALAALPPALVPDRVLVHDAARPNVSRALIDRILAALDTVSAAIPGVAVVDTLKRADAGGAVIETVPRDALWRVQTPQGFRFADLLAAHAATAGASLTDDAAVMEAAGHTVAIVEGDEDNLKVTSPGDLARMEDIMTDTTSALRQSLPAFRIGSGFDVHRFGPGDSIVLCGVDIPSDRALLGHSDADVALHAVTDAILGAIADGDIGSHFPPSDPQWRGAASDKFLQHACSLMDDAGYELTNIDVTIICEFPKVGPHRTAMRARLADICGLGISCVSVKATTTEQLGFTGRGEGIAAQASVMINAKC